MKWFQSPKIGDERVIRNFLWLPLRIGDETRWLEYAFIKQRACGISMMGEPPHGDAKWISLDFVKGPVKSCP